MARPRIYPTPEAALEGKLKRRATFQGHLKHALIVNKHRNKKALIGRLKDEYSHKRISVTSVIASVTCWFEQEHFTLGDRIIDRLEKKAKK